MFIFKSADDLHNYLVAREKTGEKTGFVPTMGALHEGHLSLLDKCKKENSLSICSIFVNPTQFNDNSDYEKYPRTVDDDIYLLEKKGCDILFFPSVSEIYPGDFVTRVYPLGKLENILEGKYRPGHFQGVCNVVDRLLSIVHPSTLYLGQKDYQQCMVIRELLKITGMEKKVSISIGPTLREPDGLAMSSRNLRLNIEQRKKASLIYRVLKEISENITEIPIASLKQKAIKRLEEQGFKVDYVEIANAQTLEPVEGGDRKEKLVALVAAFIGEVRLIDNLFL